MLLWLLDTKCIPLVGIALVKTMRLCGRLMSMCLMQVRALSTDWDLQVITVWSFCQTAISLKTSFLTGLRTVPAAA